MADILQELTIKATPQRVFEMFATPEGLDRWWTKLSSGQPKQDAEYRLFFGPDYDWRAKVSRCVPSSAAERTLNAHARPCRRQSAFQRRFGLCRYRTTY